MPRPPGMPTAQIDSGGLAFRHPKVQRLRRLVNQRRARLTERVFVVEGAKLLAEALAAGVRVESVYLAPGAGDAAVDDAFAAGARVHALAPGVLERVAGTVTPQPVMAVVPFVDVDLGALGTATLLLVCVDLRDPGNAGTVLRSAEAAGAGGVVFCEGSVDPFNPKTVRASAGSVFHVPVVVGGQPLEVLQEMARWGVRRLATTARAGADHTEVDLTGPVAFVLGNEANGLPAEVLDAADELVSIRMAGRGESLNVGMAAAVVCFEALRQRRAA